MGSMQTLKHGCFLATWGSLRKWWPVWYCKGQVGLAQTDWLSGQAQWMGEGMEVKRQHAGRNPRPVFITRASSEKTWGRMEVRRFPMLFLGPASQMEATYTTQGRGKTGKWKVMKRQVATEWRKDVGKDWIPGSGERSCLHLFPGPDIQFLDTLMMGPASSSARSTAIASMRLLSTWYPPYWVHYALGSSLQSCTYSWRHQCAIHFVFT